MISTIDPNKSASLIVTARPILDKAQKTVAFVEDQGNSFTFKAVYGLAKDWTLHTNAEWLQWSAANRTVWGIPSNLDVGNGWALVNVSDGFGNADELNLTIRVTNTPPIILTTDEVNATEDVPYSNDYRSTDDGQGVITWHLSTPATWLSINSTTGVLSGTPDNEKIGRYPVNVSVDDGNGGMDSHNFIITVLNVNDPPVIQTSEFPSATEDIFFSFNLTAMDIDPGDNLTWSIEGAPAWLHLNKRTGELSGTPTNEDVGESYLLVTVTDPGNLTDSLELKLTVLNVNDPPEILTADVTTATEDIPYRVVYQAKDIDAGDVLIWSFVRNASWLSFNPTTGVLSGLPTNEDVGSYYVNLTVTDASGAKVSHNFTLTVLNTNDPPQIESSNPPTSAMVGKRYTYQVLASDVDLGDSIRYSLDPEPLGMSINVTTGLVMWTPVEAQVGIHHVTVQVTDGVATARQSFDISVYPAPVNTRPSITSTAPSATLNIGDKFTYQVVATDAEDQSSLSFWLFKAPPDMSINATTGLVTWTPTAGQSGTHPVTVRVEDGRGGVDNQTFKVTVLPTGEDGGGGKEAGFPWAAIVLIVLVTLLIACVVAYRSRRASEAERQSTAILEVEEIPPPVIQPAMQPTSLQPPPPSPIPPPPPPPPPAAQPPPMPRTEPVAAPSQPDATSPMNEADRAKAREEREVMKVLTQLPAGLPTSLWGWDMSELARAIVNGERRKSPDGIPLVTIKGRWYIADRFDLGSFLREWDEGGEGTPEERRRKLKQLEKALLEGKVSEKTYQELRRKYEG